MENMKTFLPEADLAKLRLVLEIKDAYNRGTISLEEARKMLKEKVVTLKPYEICRPTIPSCVIIVKMTSCAKSCPQLKNWHNIRSSRISGWNFMIN